MLAQGVPHDQELPGLVLWHNGQRLPNQRQPEVAVRLDLRAVGGLVLGVRLHRADERVELHALRGVLLHVGRPVPLVVVEDASVGRVDVEAHVLVVRVLLGVVLIGPAYVRRDLQGRLRPHAHLVEQGHRLVAARGEEHQVPEHVLKPLVAGLRPRCSLQGETTAHVEAAEAIVGPSLLQVLGQLVHDRLVTAGRRVQILRTLLHDLLPALGAHPSLRLVALRVHVHVAQVPIVGVPALLPIGDEECGYGGVRVDLLYLVVDLALPVVPLEELEVRDPRHVLEQSGGLALRHLGVRPRAIQVQDLLGLEVPAAVPLALGLGVLPRALHLVRDLLLEELLPKLLGRGAEGLLGIV
mmetsp:Transcript_64369/g.199349  ORF Transcript_64369/g.199349 Transcript_64369/m.199349 type:complete len:354 (+) Transcript_64369:745-1806(+)